MIVFIIVNHTHTHTHTHTHKHTHKHTHSDTTPHNSTSDLITTSLQLYGDVHNVPDLVEEPSVNLSHFIQLVNIIASRI